MESLVMTIFTRITYGTLLYVLALFPIMFAVILVEKWWMAPIIYLLMTIGDVLIKISFKLFKGAK